MMLGCEQGGGVGDWINFNTTAVTFKGKSSPFLAHIHLGKTAISLGFKERIRRLGGKERKRKL